ncbi:MAG: hypothetical protein P0116_11545 [Candidatus Nitrosocosmicus sp.]|nr:hypothetical protein [Candidatus Nitrosocosmicus sp.]
MGNDNVTHAVQRKLGFRGLKADKPVFLRFLEQNGVVMPYG